MAIFDALMRYKQERRIRSFDLLGNGKATVRLLNGRSIVIFMSVDYIIGEAQIVEASEEPRAEYVVYNAWDRVGGSAIAMAKRLDIEVKNFGAFGHRLDELNHGF